MDEQKYLAQFETKQEIEEELKRLQRSLENINFAKSNYWSSIWRRKQLLLEKYKQKFCVLTTYQDDLGRQHSYFAEINK